MGSWYDYIPILGPAIEKYKGAINEQKQGDLTAAAQAKDVGQNIFNESLGGLDKAEGYYAPAQAMLKNAYGTPGSMTGGPGYYPVAPARGK